jgi:hypothetical protein
MSFDEILDQVRELLRSRGRLSYRALKRRFELEDEYLEDIKEELIKAERVATDEEGAVLVWRGGTDKAETENRRIGEKQYKSCQQSVPGCQFSSASCSADFGLRTSDSGL